MKTISYNIDSFGITEKSLRNLRNELARRIDNAIDIIQVNTGDITCGYLIVDYTKGDAYFTGDGFRTDYGGEGGAGMATADKLLQLYGLSTGCININLPIEKHTEEGIAEWCSKLQRRDELSFISNSLILSKQKAPYISRG